MCMYYRCISPSPSIHSLSLSLSLPFPPTYTILTGLVSFLILSLLPPTRSLFNKVRLTFAQTVEQKRAVAFITGGTILGMGMAFSGAVRLCETLASSPRPVSTNLFVEKSVDIESLGVAWEQGYKQPSHDITVHVANSHMHSLN